MKKTFTIFSFLILLTSWVNTRAGEVTVKEVALSLYNKPVNGYKVTIDRNLKFVSSQIVKHVSSFGVAKPFEYERTIIFENIIYSPVTDTRQISLYFLLNSQSEQVTELTVVSMYDYKHSINFREFPELAVKLIADLSEMVQKTCGDLLVYDNQVFEPENIDELLEKFAPGNSDANANPVDYYDNREDESNTVYIRHDPFEDGSNYNKRENADSMLKILALRRRELEVKEREMVRREIELRSDRQDLEITRAALSRQVAQAGALKDSLAKLNAKIAGFQKTILTGDEISLSNDAREIVNDLNRRLVDAEVRYAKLKARNDSLEIQISEVQDYEYNFKTKRDLLQQKINELVAKNNLLKEQLKAEKNSGPKGGNNDSLRIQTTRLLSELQVMQERNDSLLNETKLLQSKISRRDNNASASNSELRDSLNLYKTRLEKLQEQDKEVFRLRTELAERDLKIRQAQENLLKTETERNDTKSALNREEALNRELAEKLSTALTTLKELKSGSEQMLARMESYQAEINQLNKNANSLQGKMNTSQAGVRTLQDSIAKLNTEKSVVESRMRDTRIALEKESAHADSLYQKFTAGVQKELIMVMRIDSLENIVDSLKLHTAPVNDQQRFISEQWKKLETWDKELKLRETNVNVREKTATQRESFLQKKEDGINRREAALNQPGNKGNVVKQDDPVIVDDTPQPELEVILGTAVVNESGQAIGVYTALSKNTIKQTQVRIASWFLSLGYFYSDNLPDFRFENMLIYEIAKEPLQCVVRMEATNAGTMLKVSFKKPGGFYILPGMNPATDTAIQDFITKMVRFDKIK